MHEPRQQLNSLSPNASLRPSLLALIWHGVYAASTFHITCDIQHQKLSFCAVGLHQQNGKAEHSIYIIQDTSRSHLIDAIANWPSVISESFWLLAVRHAVNLHNCQPHPDKLTSPWEQFAGELPPFSPSDFRVLGSPVYVLHKELQDGSKRAKWHAWSWQGCYLGFSPLHANTVALVYNPATQHVSPQYHILVVSKVLHHSLWSNS